MISNTQLFRNSAKLLLTTVLLAVTSCKKDQLYTYDECVALKKGDTIYTKEFYTIKRCVVLKNTPEKELIEVKDIRYDWDLSILSYDDFRFK